MLYVDKEELNKAQVAYHNYSLRMESLRATLEAQVDELRNTAWKTQAAEAFFKKFDDQWLKNMDQYSDVIEHMSDNMKIANEKYQLVFEKAEELDL